MAARAMSRRKEFPASVKRAAKDRAGEHCEGCGQPFAGRRAGSRFCTCAFCDREFDRGYAMSARRAATPQYCSHGCRDAAAQAAALDAMPSRFWALVNKGGPDDCWEWMGRRDPRGYGRFDFLGRPRLAHRIAHQLTYGSIPSLDVCHHCDNPPCCNPSHHFVGTAKDNMADAAAKGRISRKPARYGESNPNARLTTEQALDVYYSSEPNVVLAARFGVSANAIRLIKIGRNWAHATGGRDAKAL